jgi:hypothetical protein
MLRVIDATIAEHDELERTRNEHKESPGPITIR